MDFVHRSSLLLHSQVTCTLHPPHQPEPLTIFHTCLHNLPFPLLNEPRYSQTNSVSVLQARASSEKSYPQQWCHRCSRYEEDGYKRCFLSNGELNCRSFLLKSDFIKLFQVLTRLWMSSLGPASSSSRDKCDFRNSKQAFRDKLVTPVQFTMSSSSCLPQTCETAHTRAYTHYQSSFHQKSAFIVFTGGLQEQVLSGTGQRARKSYNSELVLPTS